MHLKFPTDIPEFPDDVIIGQPDVNGSVKNKVNQMFRKAVMDWGRNPPTEAGSPRAYANQFLAKFPSRDQVADVGNFFDLNDDQKKAVALGADPIRFINVVWLPALASDNEPALEGGSAHCGPNTGVHGHPDTPGVSFADPATLWNDFLAQMQRNLNEGVTGAQTGVGAEAGL